MVSTSTAEVYEIDPPLDKDHETIVPYYEHARAIFELVQGGPPSRYTLYKYITELAGFPVKRHGPYVKIPHFIRRKRVFTTVESFDRFIRVVADTEAELGIQDVDVDALSRRRRRRAG